MTAAGRNACRYCRFMRCIDSGMKLEAVRMEKKPEKSAKKRKIEPESDENDENQENIFSPSAKRERQDNRLLASTLLLIDRNASDGGAAYRMMTPPYPTTHSLLEVMVRPEMLDAERSEMAWNGSMVADAAACGRSERRLFIWALDWTRQAADIEDTLGYEDKVALLRAGCAPLSLLELATHSSAATGGVQLPVDSVLARDAPLPENCFINHKLIWSLLRWAQRHLHPLQLSQRELVLLKALIVLNPDAEGLSPEGERCVAEVRARLQSALYQFCSDTIGAEMGARRLSSVLLLLPQLQVMAVEMCEQARVRNTFKGADPLLFQLFGDIFDHDDSLVHSASCSPVSSAGGDSV